MYDRLFIIVFALAFTRQTAHFVDGSNSTRKYFKLSYAVYQPGWSLINDGALQVWFRTGMKNAMVIYEDDGGQGEFLDVFLVEGRIRMRMTAGNCNFEERLINGNFSDFKWHKLVIRKEKENTTLIIDEVAAAPFQCSSQVDPMTALYTGYLSEYAGDPTQGWVFPSSRWESMKSVFQGCIKDIQYTNNGGVTRPQLRATKLTVPGCSSPCLELKCRHGGRCLDHILTAHCDCQGTGYYGDHCARVIRKTSIKPSTSNLRSTTTVKTTSGAHEIKLNPTVPTSKEPVIEKSRRKSTGAQKTAAVLWTITSAILLVLAVIVC